MCAQRTLPVLRQGQDSRHPARYVLLLAMSTTPPGGVRRWSDREAPAPLQSARIAGQMRRPPQRYVPIGKQVRLRVTVALRSLRSTTVDIASGYGEGGAEGRGAGLQSMGLSISAPTSFV